MSNSTDRRKELYKLQFTTPSKSRTGSAKLLSAHTYIYTVDLFKVNASTIKACVVIQMMFPFPAELMYSATKLHSKSENLECQQRELG